MLAAHILEHEDKGTTFLNKKAQNNRKKSKNDEKQSIGNF